MCEVEKISKRVVLIGGGLSAKHAAEILVKQKGLDVFVIQANQFTEWPLAMPVCLVKPERHDKALGPAGQVKGVTYTYGVVSSVDTTRKCILVSGDEIPYDVLIVATGFGVPLVYPKIGTTVTERKTEVQQVGAAIAMAQSVVIGGGGPIALEIAGNVRTAYPTKKVSLLTRKGILSQWPEAYRKKVEAAVDKMNIEIVASEADAPTAYSLEAGPIDLGSKTIQYDVYLPSFSLGPNTQFLQTSTDMLNAKGEIVVNELLQSTACPEVFAVGVSDFPEPFCGIAKLEAEWKTVTTNVCNFVENKPLKPHKEGMPFMKLPPVILVGHGAGAYGFLDFTNVPPPVRCCCCDGLAGWPCCPPCWPCCACCGCGCCPCGFCCGPHNGEGFAKLMGEMAFLSAGFHFQGIGKAPVQEQMQ